MPAYLINETNQSAWSQVASSLISCPRKAGLLEEPVSKAETESGVSGRIEIDVVEFGFICCRVLSAVEFQLL